MAFCLFHDICISLSGVLNFQIPESQFPGSGRYGRFRSGWKVQSPALFFAASSKASEKEKSIFFTKRPHPLLVASSDSASLLIGLMPPVDQPDFLVCF